MLTRMTEEDWAVTLEVFRAACSRRGDKGRDDRRFLQAMHDCTVRAITWRALPAAFGPWNSVWKRFWRLSRAGVFEAFVPALADLSLTAHPVQMFNSTAVRAHVSAAGAKGGRTARRWAALAVAGAPRSTWGPDKKGQDSTVGGLARRLLRSEQKALRPSSGA